MKVWRVPARTDHLSCVRDGAWTADTTGDPSGAGWVWQEGAPAAGADGAVFGCAREVGRAALERLSGRADARPGTC